MSRNISQNNGKSVRILNSGIYNANDPKDPQNILKKEQLEQPQKQPLANGFINLIPTNKKKNQKDTYYPPDSSNQKQQEKYQIEKSREKRSTSEINTFSRQSPIEQGKIYHPQQTQAQSRPISQNKKINFKAAYTYTYYPWSEQHQLPNSDKICVPHNRNYQINGLNELQKSTSPIQSHTSRQQDNKQSLNSINQGHSQTERCNYQEDNEYLLAKTIIPPNMSIQDQLKKCNTNSSIELKRQSNNESLKLINQSQFHRPITPQKLQSNENLLEYNSQLQSSKKCYFCQDNQQTNLISLTCNHQFHIVCLKKMMEQQVNIQMPIIKCKCKAKIPQNIIKQYLDYFQLYIYYQIQVQNLPNFYSGTYKWKKCPNHGCDFLYLDVPQVILRETKIKCPNCIENILAQSIQNQIFINTNE